MSTPRLLPFPLAMIGVAALAGCGASYQRVYEGDVRFEHCYRLDADASVGAQQRLACWNEWSQNNTIGQTSDRVIYARRRQTALQAGESDLAGPSLVTGRPSPVATQAFALRPTLTVTAPPASPASTTVGTTTGAPASSSPTTMPTGRTALVQGQGGSSGSAPHELSSHQQCAHDCGVTFTSCVSQCTDEPCGRRCGTQVKVCIDHCL